MFATKQALSSRAPVAGYDAEVGECEQAIADTVGIARRTDREAAL
jgi:hypothetical protein